MLTSPPTPARCRRPQELEAATSQSAAARRVGVQVLEVSVARGSGRHTQQQPWPLAGEQHSGPCAALSRRTTVARAGRECVFCVSPLLRRCCALLSVALEAPPLTHHPLSGCRGRVRGVLRQPAGTAAGAPRQVRGGHAGAGVRGGGGGRGVCKHVWSADGACRVRDSKPCVCLG